MRTIWERHRRSNPAGWVPHGAADASFYVIAADIINKIK